ncbi:Hypothetical predicted protein [Podarcis lilfordi]|uniref:Uncharacterized protein n=1 Tax=Podarcis lilfordi TaxID=74358 RepID=A0AA35L5X6_9SAUR|nr:Hypothetical predicted protein [Podarcis lilfordi]
MPLLQSAGRSLSLVGWRRVKTIEPELPPPPREAKGGGQDAARGPFLCPDPPLPTHPHTLRGWLVPSQGPRSRRACRRAREPPPPGSLRGGCIGGVGKGPKTVSQEEAEKVRSG